MTLHVVAATSQTALVGISRISVGVDTSPTSLEAFAWSMNLAQECDARVRAVTTWERPLAQGVRQLVTGTPSAQVLSQQSRDQLLQALKQFDDLDDVETVVLNAAPGPALVAESRTADLLVVGRTGRGFGRTEQLLLGSVARYCMRFASGHVAVVPRTAVWNPAPSAVVGMDGSANSIDALTWAIDNLPAATTIYAVRAQERSFGEAAHVSTDSSREIVAKAKQELRRDTDTAATAAGTTIAEIVEHVEVGSARHVLLRPEFNADLIVVGSPGHAGITATMFGSVADHVARHASCPVIIVRPTRAAPTPAT